MFSLTNRRFLLLSAIMFLTGVASSAVIPLFPTYIEDYLHRPVLFGANLRFLFFFLGGISAVPAGVLCDHWGRKRTLVVGVTGAISSGALFLTGHPLALSLLCIHAGLTSGIQSTASQTYLMGSVGKSQFGLASALFFIAYNLGNAFGSRWSGLLAKSHGYYVMGAVMTAVAAVGWMTALLLPRLPLAKEGRSFAEVWNLLELKRLLRRSEVLYLIGLRFLVTCYWGAVTFTLPLLLARLSHYDPRVPANYQSVYLIVAMCFQLLTGRLCDRLGRTGPVLVSSSLIALSALLLAFSLHSVTALYAFGVMAAAAAWSLSTTMPGIINDVAGPEEKGRLMSLTHVAWSTGMALGTWGAGRLVDVSSVMTFGLCAGLCALAVACAVALLRGISSTSPASRA